VRGRVGPVEIRGSLERSSKRRCLGCGPSYKLPQLRSTSRRNGMRRVMRFTPSPRRRSSAHCPPMFRSQVPPHAGFPITSFREAQPSFGVEAIVAPVNGARMSTMMRRLLVRTILSRASSNFFTGQIIPSQQRQWLSTSNLRICPSFVEYEYTFSSWSSYGDPKQLPLAELSCPSQTNVKSLHAEDHEIADLQFPETGRRA